MPEHDCLFCKIIAGEIPAALVHQDERCIAIRDINPQAPTHILVIPRRHIPTLDDLDDGEAGLVGTLMVRAAQIARNLHLNSDGYRVVANCGEAAVGSLLSAVTHPSSVGPPLRDIFRTQHPGLS